MRFDPLPRRDRLPEVETARCANQGNQGVCSDRLRSACCQGILPLILEGRRIAFSEETRGRRKVRTPKGAMPRNPKL